MPGRIPSRIAPVPDSKSTNVARPLFARSVLGYANNITHLVGMRGLRISHQVCDMNAPVTTNDIPPTGAMTNAPRLRYVVSPLARYIWWGGVIAADIVASGTLIKVHLETTAGVNIDGPIEWSGANGRLPSRKYATDPTDTSFLGASQGRDMLIHTDWREVAAGTAPRLLDADGYQGLDVVIRVETLNVRVYSHWAHEAYRPQL